MAKSTIATIRGTMIVPGVSKNLRLYTREAIGRMVERAQQRINNNDAPPIVMRTHHDAGDDSTRIVGRITNITQDADGSARYEAKLYNTTQGRDIATLIGDPEQPALRNTSIYGYWVGPVERVKQDGKTVESGNDLEVDALDFTGSPGVAASRIDAVTMESTTGKHRITESADAEITINHEVLEAAVEDEPIRERDFNTKQRKKMAAAGQAMPDGSYPIANKSDLRNAIRAVGRGSGSHNAIRQHIIKRAKALGLSNMIPDNWTAGGAKKETTMPDAAAEHYIKVCVGDIDGDMLKVCADNLHPDVLKDAIKKAGKLIDQIIGQDGTDLGQSDEDDMIDDVNDIDWKVITCTPEGDDYSSDQLDDMADGGTVSGESVRRVRGKLRAAREKKTDLAPTKESTVDDTKQDAVQTAPGLTEADMTKLAALIGAAVKEAMVGDMTNAATAGKAKNKKNKKSDTSDNGPATDESVEGKDAVKENGVTAEDLEKKLAETRAAAVAETREQILKEFGPPSRKGFRRVQENEDTEIPTGDELWDKRAEVWATVAPALYANAAQLVPTATDA